MSGVQRFEDLIAWQKARVLTKEIFALTGDERIAKNYRFTGQIQGAAVSAMSNIAEGFERGGLAEFHRFLVIAKASCGEVRSLLYVALDADLIDMETFSRLRARTEEVSRIVGGLRASVERRLNSSTARRLGEADPIPYDVES